MRLQLLILFSAIALLSSTADHVRSAQIVKRTDLASPLVYHSTAQTMSKRSSPQSGENSTSLQLTKRRHKHRHHHHHRASSQARGNTHSGHASYYGGGEQACGGHSGGQYIAALSSALYEGGKHCDKTVRITSSSGKSVSVLIRDECPTCDPYKLDLSEEAFRQLAPLKEGIVAITWYFVD